MTAFTESIQAMTSTVFPIACPIVPFRTGVDLFLDPSLGGATKAEA